MSRVVVIDTNVLKVANGRREAPQATPACVAACAESLAEVRSQYAVALDDLWLILSEYTDNVNASGEPGPGDAFLKWLLRNWANPSRCHFVRISQLPNPPYYREFPLSLDLTTFDIADRKFVAVALSHVARPPIYVAIDRGWRQHDSALVREGVSVGYLCPEQTPP